MADFQSQVAIDIDVDNIVSVQDQSPYDSNGEPSHARARFSDFLLIEVTRPVDAQKYILATTAALTADTDETIDAPSANSGDQWSLPEDFAHINGTYSVLLISIPTWNAGVAYNPLSTVYYAGAFYRCDSAVLAAQPAPDLNSTDWTPTTLNDIRDEPEYVEYRATDSVTVTSFVYNTEYFEATLESDGVLGIVIDSAGTSFSVYDHSNYDSNDENGHARARFNAYRSILITRPNGNTWQMSTIGTQDQTITAPSTGNTSFQYDFISADTDGVWGAALTVIPTWNDNEYYNSETASQEVLVYHNSKIWASESASLGVEPGTDTDYWVEYTGDITTTRYYYTNKFVVKALNFTKCLNKAILAASKTIQDSPCSDNLLCKDKNFIKAMKLMILERGIEVHSCFRQYDIVAREFEAAEKIICDGC